MRKESAAVAKALGRFAENQVQLQTWAEKFYADHGDFIADVLQVSPETAKRFAQNQCDKLLLSVRDGCLKAFVEEIEHDESANLIQLVGLEVNHEQNPAHLVAA